MDNNARFLVPPEDLHRLTLRDEMGIGLGGLGEDWQRDGQERTAVRAGIGQQTGLRDYSGWSAPARKRFMQSRLTHSIGLSYLARRRRPSRAMACGCSMPDT